VGGCVGGGEDPEDLRISEPAADDSTTNVGPSVDETDEQGVVHTLGADAVDLGEEQVGTVGTGLVPTLDGGANGAGDDGQPESPGQAPLVLDLVLEGELLVLGEGIVAADGVEVLTGERGGDAKLGDEGALAQDGDVVGQTLLVGEGLNIAHQLALGDAGQRVGDLGLDVPVDVDCAGRCAALELVGARLGVTDGSPC